MAKKGNRVIIALECTVCGSKNYTSYKNKLNTVDKIDLKKYCPKCKDHTLHKESKVK